MAACHLYLAGAPNSQARGRQTPYRGAAHRSTAMGTGSKIASAAMAQGEPSPVRLGHQGRSSEAAVWQCSLFDEAAKGRGLLSATTLVDLTKAFEMVKLRDIWLAARRHDFPLRLIRPALEAFSFARRLCYQGAVSAPVDTKTAILAGGGFAQLALLLVLLDPLDEIHAIFSGRSVNLCAYVDDIALHAVGTETEICSGLVQATDHLVSILEGGLDMQVSRREAWSTAGQTKTVTVASSRPLAKSLSTPMRRLGILMKTKAKHLGVEFTPGSRTREPRREKSRWALNAARRARAIRLGRCAAHTWNFPSSSPRGSAGYGTAARPVHRRQGNRCALRP